MYGYVVKYDNKHDGSTFVCGSWEEAAKEIQAQIEKGNEVKVIYRPDPNEFIRLLREECAKANELIGTLRYALPHFVSDSDYVLSLLYQQYKDARERRQQLDHDIRLNANA